eukprot:c26491_g1_i1.p1 GENE.c26491_g1_i1~~c26491_g1_i1.p1  ORF type:complete len:152 (+),score=18.43 c26491_g1_i1:26-457(+)
MSKEVRVGVSVLCVCPEYPGCVLVGTRKGSHGAGRVAFPGGHLEMGEEFYECAARELLEETALVAAEGFTYETVTNDVMTSENKHYVTVFVKGTITNPSELQAMEPNKCEKWEWVKWDELRQLSPDALFLPLANVFRTSYSPF